MSDAHKSMRKIDALPIRREEIYAACLRVLRNPHDAEDACQEALIAIARDAASVRDERKLAAWARRVATTSALDFRRRLERRRAHEARVRPAPAAAAEAVDVHGALQKLDEPERQAVAAHYLDGRPLRELAREQGVSEVAVWKRLDKAKSKLRILLAAALPAAIIAATLMVALLRPAAPAPAVPQEEREAWPWEMPPRDWPEPVKKTWTALQKRVTLDIQDTSLSDFLAMVSGFIGRPIAEARPDPGEMMSFKVQDILAEGALTLALQPRGKGFQIQDDGTIWVAPAEEIDPAKRRRGADARIDAARRLERIHSSGPSRPLAAARAGLAKKVKGPKGEQSLRDYLQGMRDASGVRLILDAAVERPSDITVRGVDEELSVAAHLRSALAPEELEAVETLEGVVLVTRAAQAAEVRRSPAWLAQEALEESLRRPMGAEDVGTVPKLVRRLEKLLGARVLATKAAWESTPSAAPRPGEKAMDYLDRLDGLKWTSTEGILILFK